MSWIRTCRVLGAAMFLMLQLGVHAPSALASSSVESSARAAATEMIEGTARLVAKTAWPTATFRRAELHNVRVSSTREAMVTVRFYCTSAAEFEGDIWFDLDLTFSLDAGFTAVDVGDYRAFIRSFATTGVTVRMFQELDNSASGGCQETTAALDRSRASCAAGVASSCRQAGYLLGGEHGVCPDRTGSFEFYKKACLFNDSAGCYEAGRLISDSNGVASAVPFYEVGCSLEVSGRGTYPPGTTFGADFAADNCYKLGTLYYFGTGVGQDWSKAGVYLRAACSLGKRDDLVRSAGCK